MSADPQGYVYDATTHMTQLRDGSGDGRVADIPQRQTVRFLTDRGLLEVYVRFGVLRVRSVGAGGLEVRPEMSNSITVALVADE